MSHLLLIHFMKTSKALLVLFFSLNFIPKISFSQHITDSKRAEYIAKTQKVFPGVKQEFFEIDETWNTLAKLKKVKNQEVVSFATSSGGFKDFVPYGILTFKIKGKKQSLVLYASFPVNPLYKDYLFLPFKDLTSGKETYGAGRYMDINIHDIKDGLLWLDFNTCYNPYCAFADNYTCPIPPKENQLKIAVTAGEKKPL